MKQKEKLENKGYSMISLKKNAELRMQEGKDVDISKKGNWTREVFIYDTQKGIYLAKKSPIILNSREATKAHRNGNEYFLTDEQIEEALTDSVGLSSGKSIPTNRFNENEITSYAFGDVAEDYGKWLDNEAGIKEMPIYIYLADFSGKSFARQNWFTNLNEESGLCGSKVLYSDDRLLGVKGTNFVNPQNLEEILNKKNMLDKKRTFDERVMLLNKMNKIFDLAINKQEYENARKILTERDKLYDKLIKELR